ncbi:PucR family transcriptional regulator [Gulosibacter sediminis]|uniref:PucR family transcriptional regulator n=1 Tax=Gulosibacter sediminis TaxID=1729695 RepID=UPI0024ACF92C|nr:PucR family transcriptional regulator [Gulosibacter sediminis]
MVTTIAGLLRTPELGLRPRLGDDAQLRRPVDWAVVTELIDPSPYLAGGELVLTTGVRLRTPGNFEQFVSTAAKAGSAGIGFGVGISHDELPDALLASARRAGLPVFEVPFEVAFSEVIRRVAELNESERVAKLESRYRQRHRLVELLLSDGGLDAMLERLEKETGAHFAVSLNGEVVSGTLEVDDPAASGWDALPIALGSSGQATLHATRPRDDDLVNGARSLVGLYLAQAARRVRAAREQAGQVLAELGDDRFDDAATASRLEQLGLRLDRSYRMVVAEQQRGSRGELGGMRIPVSLQATATAIIDDALVVVLDERVVDPHIAAEVLLVTARAAGISVHLGVGGAYPVSPALRWSWYEARDALASLGDGEEIGHAERLSLASLILSADEAPLAQLAQQVLGPLERSDAEHGTALVDTLDAWLAHSGSVAEVADALGTHRNTVRYRIEQIVKVSGLDPRVTADVVQFSLARTATRLLRRSARR